MINQKQEKFELVISADEITSTDERFTMSNLSLGDNYKVLDSHFKKSNGEIIKRKRDKGERKSSNRTMARIACQVFEKQLDELSIEEKENFPVCRYKSDSELIRGIFPSVSAYKQIRNTKSIEYVVYSYSKGRQFVFYNWNIFSSIIFVQECLKRFGEAGDEFVLTYQEKDEEEAEEPKVQNESSDEAQEFNGYLNSYSEVLVVSKNIIFRGAPGTGKTFLAQQIAASMISEGRTDELEQLTAEEKKQLGFVQFHPSYDYTDFVEGLRPTNSGAEVGFELVPGVFKEFCERAKEKISAKDAKSLDDIWDEFIESLGDEKIEINNYKFQANSKGNVTYSVPGGSIASLTLGNVKDYIENGKWGSKNYHSTYKTPIFEKYIQPKLQDVTLIENKKPYIFIIDEINRGEISKIFGELFFSLDPGYRGPKGEVLTQYSKLHEDKDEKFFIPENVYIIGTMNDIDRSVDTFDFAMRRRFTFIEITAEQSANNMLTNDETKDLMTRLNKALVDKNKGGLTRDYEIGASYFLEIDVKGTTNEVIEPLWNNKLEPLLMDYFRGEHEVEKKVELIKNAYFTIHEEG